MKPHQPDYIVTSLLFLIILIGLIMLSSASVVVAQEKFGDSYWYLKHQLILGLIPGVILFFLFSKIPYFYLKKFTLPLLFLTIVLLAFVLIPQFSFVHGGARRWLYLGSFSFQPAEVTKLSFILYLASWLQERGKKIKDFSQSFLPFVFVLGLISFLIALEPDLGTMGVIVTSSIIVYFIAGGKLKHLFFLILSGLLFFVFLVKIAPYRTARLITFLNPGFDPQGIGYHINQALLAVGSGGFFGLGLGHSQQKYFYLPEVTGDSIFAIIAEEIGFIFSLGIIALFSTLIWRGFRISAKAPDVFGRLIACGITSWIAIQTLINMGAMVGLVPLTGLPLPFISYGGTALAVALAGMGIVVNISRYTR